MNSSEVKSIIFSRRHLRRNKQGLFINVYNSLRFSSTQLKSELYYQTGYGKGEYRTIIKTGPNETVVIMGIKNHIGKKNKIRCDKEVPDASLNEYSIRLRTIQGVHRVQIFRLSSIDLLHLLSGIVHPTQLRPVDGTDIVVACMIIIASENGRLGK